MFRWFLGISDQKLENIKTILQEILTTLQEFLTILLEFFLKMRWNFQRILIYVDGSTYSRFGQYKDF